MTNMRRFRRRLLGDLPAQRTDALPRLRTGSAATELRDARGEVIQVL